MKMDPGRSYQRPISTTRSPLPKGLWVCLPCLLSASHLLELNDRRGKLDPGSEH